MTFLARIKGQLGLKGTSRELKSTCRQRQGKIDREYLADLRRLPCVICEAWGYRQTSPIEAHYTI